MKKVLKITGLVLAALILLLLIAGFLGWKKVKSNLLDFEKDYVENTSIKELTVDGFTFFDRNDNNKLDIYEDDRKTTSERVDDLLNQMTLEEKIHLLKGSGIASGAGLVEEGEGIAGAVGTIVPTPRLGIPTVYLSDGPAGLRIQPTRKNDDKTYYCTAFPIASMLASTWNTELVKEVGDAMGKEALAYGIDVILGPGANLHRHPLCGRNFEYYSEDPLLSGKLGAAMVNGIEQNGVGTSVKHFVANNQESNRFINNSMVSERALREIYLKGFEIIVKEAQPWTIMSSYNKVNGTYVSEHKYLLTDVLRDEWDYKGLVMTDWFGGRDAAAMIKAGNDLLEPGTNKQWKALKKAYKEGVLTEGEIDVAARRILKLIVESKKMQGYVYDNNPDLKKHAQVTRQSAAEGMVLLKNQDALPLSEKSRVALIGTTSYDFIAGGTGSGDVNEAYTVSLEEGLLEAGIKINSTAQKAYEEFKTNNPEAFEKPEGLQAMLNPYSPPELDLNIEKLETIAKESDMAILTIGRNAGEGGDRVEKDDFLLSEVEQRLIQNTCSSFQKLGKKVVVVMNIGGVIETATWKQKPDAIVLAWQGGQEGGNSVADVLCGKVNPSGKLPMTFPVHLNDHASNANFPLHGEKMTLKEIFSDREDKPEEEQIKNKDYTLYEEGIYVGYRHFDKANLAVSYPFGFGLSYTQFDFSNFEVKLEDQMLHISAEIENVGDKAGKEVVQIYASKRNTAIDRPNKELKAFGKTRLLLPGEKQQVELKIPEAELSYWDEDEAKWTLEKGAYAIHLAASSRDLKVQQQIEL